MLLRNPTDFHYTQSLAIGQRNLPWLMSFEFPLRHGTCHPNELNGFPWYCVAPKWFRLLKRIKSKCMQNEISKNIFAVRVRLDQFDHCIDHAISWVVVGKKIGDLCVWQANFLHLITTTIAILRIRLQFYWIE